MNILEIIKNPNTTLVDVRQVSEYQEEKASGAINIPLASIPLRLEEFRQMPGPIVVHCLSGGRSGQASTFLKSQGFEQVYNAGGLSTVLQLQQAIAQE